MNQSWLKDLRADPTPLLLARGEPPVRYLTLVDILGLPRDDEEVAESWREVEGYATCQKLLAEQLSNGSWQNQVSPASHWSLFRLGFIGFTVAHEKIQRGAEFLLEHQLPDGRFAHQQEWKAYHQGQFDLNQHAYPITSAMITRCLAKVGLPDDPRVSRSYTWLMQNQLSDGTWSTGKAFGVTRKGASYRFIPGSSGCRSTTTAALAALSLSSIWRKQELVWQGARALLRLPVPERTGVGSEIARIAGRAQPHGRVTFLQEHDPVLLLSIVGRLGLGRTEPCVDNLVVAFLRRQNEWGLWEHPYHRDLTLWMSLMILRALKQIHQSSN